MMADQWRDGETHKVHAVLRERNVQTRLKGRRQNGEEFNDLERGSKSFRSTARRKRQPAFSYAR